MENCAHDICGERVSAKPTETEYRTGLQWGFSIARKVYLRYLVYRIIVLGT